MSPPCPRTPKKAPVQRDRIFGRDRIKCPEVNLAAGELRVIGPLVREPSAPAHHAGGCNVEVYVSQLGDFVWIVHMSRHPYIRVPILIGADSREFPDAPIDSHDFRRATAVARRSQTGD